MKNKILNILTAELYRRKNVKKANDRFENVKMVDTKRFGMPNVSR